LSITNNGNFNVACLRCGSYRISAEAEAFIRNDSFDTEQAANISGYIRENQNIAILNADLKFLRALKTPAVGEKAMKGLLALARKYPVGGQHISVDFHFAKGRAKLLKDASQCDDLLREAFELQSLCWARSLDELQYVLEEFLAREGLVIVLPTGGFKLAPRGWARVDELRRGTVDSDKAFVAMSFDPKYSRFFELGLRPGIQRAGYDPIRIDRVEHNNRIDDEIVATIRQCKFLVADFSVNRGGIYFEAGFAVGLGRPVIWTVQRDELENVHFDTRQYNFVRWTNDSLPEFAKALQNRIEASAIGRGPLRTTD
jgi:hypothetical protein